MRVPLVVSLALFSVSVPVAAQCTTFVPTGVVSGTWAVSGSPFCIQGDIRVGALTIEAGVSVLFEGEFLLSVPGVLTAVGTKSKPITFAPKAQAGAWKGIGFSFSQVGSELAHVVVTGSTDGGIKIENTAVPPILSDCVISGNSRRDGGGGLLVKASGPVTLTRCVISENSADNKSGGHPRGGGIYVEGELTLEQTIVADNLVLGRGGTGGLKLARGGGIYSSGRLNVRGSVITRNVLDIVASNSTVEARGGGLFIDGEASIISSVISANKAMAVNYAGLPGWGSASRKGGGVYVEQTVGPVTLVNTTIYMNSGGAALQAGTESDSIIVNSIIWGDSAEIETNDSVVVTFSDVQGGYEGAGNISLDPLFEDPSSDQLLHLAPGSPAIDSVACDPQAATDIDGEQRPVGLLCDMGADEYSIRPPVIEGVGESAGNLQHGSPGSWFTIYGSGFGDVSRAWKTEDFNEGILPVTLAGVWATVDGDATVISYVSPHQINALLPWRTPLGTAQVRVGSPDGESAEYEFEVVRSVPEFFSYVAEDHRYVAAVHLDGVVVGPADARGKGDTRPARQGDVIAVYVSGLGLTTPVPDDGILFNGSLPLANPQDLIVRIADQECNVLFAGLTSQGLYQLNIELPDLPPGDQAMTVEIGGVKNSVEAFLYIGNE